MSTTHWIPLESNPEVLNEYSNKIGLSEIGTKYAFTDVFGLDPDILAFVPAPQIAVLLLFPITEETEKLRHEQKSTTTSPTTTSPYFMKQTIGNACGTIGLLHIAMNCIQQNTLHPSPGSFADHFYSATKDLSPEERGLYLEKPPQGAMSLADIHKDAAEQGQTTAPAADADVDLHFIAFIEHGGRLYELDGRKAGPIDHGEIESSLLVETARVVKSDFVDKAQSLNFSLIALAGVDE